MVAAMAEWIEKDVQPAARKILGAPNASPSRPCR
jgi:hypothetical protein